MTKLKAFASHMGISFVIFLVILFLLIFKWYPPPFFSTDGGWQGIRIIAGVDLVLGPLLTLIVFKPGKPGLKFDLTLIGIFQASALSWGIWIVHHERPIAAVFADNYFNSVTYNEIKSYGMTQHKLRAFGNNPPYWIYSDLPRDPKKLQKVRIDALHMGLPLSQLVDYYKPLDTNTLQDIRGRSIDMERWLKHKPAQFRIYRQFLQDHGNNANLVFVPWHARNKFEIIAFNIKTGKYAGTLGIKPPDSDIKYPLLSARYKNTRSAASQAASQS